MSNLQETIDTRGCRYKFDLDSAIFSIEVSVQRGLTGPTKAVKTTSYSILAYIPDIDNTEVILVSYGEYTRLYSLFMRTILELIINGEDHETKNNVS